MNDLLCRICTGFIWDKEKRQNFRSKHMDSEKMKKIIEKSLEKLIAKNTSINASLTEANIAEKIDNSREEILALIKTCCLSRENLDAFKWHLENDIIRGVQRSIATAAQNSKAFGGYRYKHTGETLVLFGAGPTVNYFEPIQNAKYVGLNRAFLYDRIKFDYLFAIDRLGVFKIYDELIKYPCIKFIGDQNLGADQQISENIIQQIPDARIYKTDCNYLSFKVAHDIEVEPLGNANTVAIQAMQFIMYTNPSKIYLVGIDCSGKGHFTDNTDKDFTGMAKGADETNVRGMIDMWKQIKVFAQKYYPEMAIISVNPIGLKGIFKDVYTERYLKEHPEIAQENVEILDRSTANEKN